MGSHPGQGDIISSKIKLSESNNLPVDRVIVYPIIFLTVISLINLLYMVYQKNAYMM